MAERPGARTVNHESSSNPSTVQRAPGILWRLAGDRVMTHRIDAPPTTTANDLIGAVGLVWLALDEPATINELRTRLAEADVAIDDVVAELDRLLVAGLVIESDHRERS